MSSLETYHWSMNDKGEHIRIKTPSQLEFIGDEIKENLIRTTKAIGKASSSFYFEAKMINSGKDGVIAIGLTQANPSTRSGHFPGWKSEPTLGIGYHGDDGGIFYESNKAIERGESYATGDIVGCYMCRTRMNDEDSTLVQFTRNGKMILFPRMITNDDCYPTIGLGSPRAIVDTRFDINEFSFDMNGTYYSRNILYTQNEINSIYIQLNTITINYIFLHIEGEEMPRQIDNIVEQLQNIGFEDRKIFAAIKSSKSLDIKAVAKRLSNAGIHQIYS